MELLNEIHRIKNLMSLTEATNPILSFVTGPFVKKAWESMVSSYGGSLKNTLSNVSRTDLDAIFERLNPGRTLPTDIDDLFGNVISQINKLTKEELDSVIITLSKYEPFRTGLIDSFKNSKPFMDAISKAFSGSDMSPQEIKNVLKTELGDDIGAKLFDELKVRFDPSATMKKVGIETFTLPSTSIQDLKNLVEDPNLKTTIEAYLTPNNLNKLFKEAESAANGGIVIDSNYFRTEFAKIVKDNPNFWTEIRRKEFSKLLNRLLNLLKRKDVSILAALAIALNWAASEYKSGKKETYETFLQKCMKGKGYNNQKDIEDAKINKPEDLKSDFFDCKNEAKSLSMGKGIEKLGSNIPSFEEEEGMTIDDVFGTATSTTSTSTYSDDIDSFKKWMVTRKLKGTPVPSITGVGFDLNGVNYIFDTPSTGFK